MKVYTYTFIVVGIMLLFFLAGFNTTVGAILGFFNLVDNPQNFATTPLYLGVIAVFAAIGAGIAISYFTKSPADSSIVAPLCSGILALFISDVISIIVDVRAKFPDQMWLSYIVLLFLAPVAIGYLISLIEWWRGTD